MHPLLFEDLVRQHVEDLHRAAARSRLASNISKPATVRQKGLRPRPRPQRAPAR